MNLSHYCLGVTLAATALRLCSVLASPVQQAYLKASNTDPFDSFGYSVALSGDTIVVGAPSEDSGATGVNGNQSDNNIFNAGAAYVFLRTGTNWSQQAYLKASSASGTRDRDNFGSSVAISSNTVVVGAPYEDSDVAISGAVYVFVRNGSTWVQQALLKAPSPGRSDLFGASLAISGDTLVVGAYAEDSSAEGVNGNQADDSAPDSGAAYVFVRSGNSWALQAYLKPSTTRIFG